MKTKITIEFEIDTRHDKEVIESAVKKGIYWALDIKHICAPKDIKEIKTVIEKFPEIDFEGIVMISKVDPNVIVAFQETVCDYRFSGRALTDGKLPDGRVHIKQWRNYWYTKDFEKLEK